VTSLIDNGTSAETEGDVLLNIREARKTSEERKKERSIPFCTRIKFTRTNQYEYSSFIIDW